MDIFLITHLFFSQFRKVFSEMEKKSQRHRLFARARKKHQNPNRDTDENSIENQGADR